jgi:hypothetical protein
MWCALLDFNIAHRAMMDEFASVLGRRLGYLPNAHPFLARGAQDSRSLFVHDPQIPYRNRLFKQTVKAATLSSRVETSASVALQRTVLQRR